MAAAGAFGAPSLQMPAIPFSWTSYYEQELGPKPVRTFLGFPQPFNPERLADAKMLTNALEHRLAAEIPSSHPRPVNIDPGYLAPDKLVLASAKNFSHRIYLSRGIYAEVTLRYAKGRFVSLPWTFPDYASGAYHPFFLRLRGTLMENRRHPPGRDARERAPPRENS